MAPVAFEDIGHHDEMVVRFGEALEQECGLGSKDVLVRLRQETHPLGLHTVEQRKAAADAFVWGEGEDRRVLRSQVRDVERHVAVEGEDDHLGLGKVVGQRHGSGHGLLPRTFDDRLAGESRAAATLDAARHAVENFHALHGVFAHARFAAQHDRVRLLVDRVGHVGDLRAGRKGIGDHGLEHMGGHDDRFADLQAALDDAALDDGKLFHRAFDAKISAGHHDGVGGRDDFFDEFDRVLVLDLGDDVRVAAQPLQFGAHGFDVGLLAAETQGEVVDFQLHAHDDVLEVFLGHGRKVDLHPGQIDVAAGAEHALGQDFAVDAVFFFGQHLHVEVAIVDQHDITLVNVVDQPVVVHVHRVEFLAFRPAHGELDLVSRVQIEVGCHVAGPDGGALGVHHDGDIRRSLAGYLADAGDDDADPFVRGMAHVEPENIGAGGDQAGQHLGGIRGRAESADDFGFAHGTANRAGGGEARSSSVRPN